MKQLIVTADDFGIAKSINAGIAKACKDGIVTSISVLASGDAFQDAVEVVRNIGMREIGAHLALTGTRPVADPAKIRTLVLQDGQLCKGHAEFFAKYFFRLINNDDIYIELKSQMEKLKVMGLPITSISSHEHVHMMPGVLEIFIRLAHEYNIPVIRYLHKDWRGGRISIGKFYKTCVLNYFDKRTKSALDKASIACTDYLIGFLDSGRIDEAMILDIIASLEEGTTELVVHPGFLGPMILEKYRFHLNCERELFFLTSLRVKKLIDQTGVKLVTFSQFLNQK
jgi:chitin disaccharide deacetylase